MSGYTPAQDRTDHSHFVRMITLAVEQQLVKLTQEFLPKVGFHPAQDYKTGRSSSVKINETVYV